MEIDFEEGRKESRRMNFDSDCSELEGDAFGSH
jgi:hypothetical protein